MKWGWTAKNTLRREKPQRLRPQQPPGRSRNHLDCMESPGYSPTFWGACRTCKLFQIPSFWAVTHAGMAFGGAVSLSHFFLLQVTTHLSVLLWINSIKLIGSTISWMLWYKYFDLTWVSRCVCCISLGKALSYNVWNNSEITKVSNGTFDLFCVILTRSPTHLPTMRTHKARGLMWNLNSLTFSYIVLPNNKSKLACWCSESCCQQSRQQLDWRQSVQKKSN